RHGKRSSPTGGDSTPTGSRRGSPSWSERAGKVSGRSRAYRPAKKETTMTSQITTAPNPNKALWEKGDFTRIAATMRESGEALVGSLGITRGLEVLDLGSGDGTTAIPAAELGAEVLAVDIAANLVAAGNARAESRGLHNITFEEGDASDLHELGDDSFD